MSAPPAASTNSAMPLPPPSWRLVFMLALPVLGQQGLSVVVGLSDRYLGGHLPIEIGPLPGAGTVGLLGAPAGAGPYLAASALVIGNGAAAVQAAQTTAHYLAWFITCYNVLVTVGSTALVARFVGAGDRARAVAVTHQALLLAVGLGLLATVAGLLGGIRLLVALLQLQGAAADYAVAYAVPLFALLVFQAIEAAGIACLIGAGDTRTGLMVMVGVALLNLPLAWGFGWGFGPLPALGFVGIAIGTALSHTLGGIAVVTLLARGRSGLKLRRALFRPDLALLGRLLRISVPAGFDSLSVVAGQFWFLSIINQLGNDAASAHGIALQWESLGYLSGSAFGTAAMALVGQNLGAGRPDRATRSGWLAFGLGCAVMSLMGAIFFAFAPEMFRLFCPKPEQAPIIVLGVPVLRLVAFAMPALASSIVFTYALRGAGDTRVPVLFTWIGFFVVRIPLAYLLTSDTVALGPFGTIPGLGLGLLGAWWAMFADLIVRGGFFVVRFARGTWQRQKV